MVLSDSAPLHKKSRDNVTHRRITVSLSFRLRYPEPGPLGLVLGLFGLAVVCCALPKVPVHKSERDVSATPVFVW
jgi:hypothetical protein